MTVEWVTPIGQTRAMTMALHSVADETRTAHGCVGCSVSIDIDTRGLVRYTEEWLTEDDLRQRLLADSFSRLFTLIQDATPPPRIEFTLAHQTRGLDFIEEVRASVR